MASETSAGRRKSCWNPAIRSISLKLVSVDFGDFPLVSAIFSEPLRWDLKAIFSAKGDNIITSFNDATILIWSTDGFQLQWRITLERFAATSMISPSGDDTPMSEVLSKNQAVTRNTCFASSYGGDFLVYAGLLNTIFVWNLVEKTMIHELDITSFSGTTIKQVEFVGASQIVGVLSSDGRFIFIDAIAGKQVGHGLGEHTAVSGFPVIAAPIDESFSVYSLILHPDIFAYPQVKSFAFTGDGAVMSYILQDSKYVISTLLISTLLEGSVGTLLMDTLEAAISSG
ncbi:hypothetical protein HK102_010791 [Quaeritorhiza haematococci]|nr:hypothetical protein HK102_010791 [Quaeritorhiza haematococci]